jgi:hypothetical protein
VAGAVAAAQQTMVAGVEQGDTLKKQVFLFLLVHKL